MTELADRFRREGRADAVVMLVARRIHAENTAADWAAHLDLDQADVAAAVQRLKDSGKPILRPGDAPAPIVPPVERHLEVVPPPKPKPKRQLPENPTPCPTCGQVCRDRRGLVAHVRGVHTVATCDACGKVTTLGGLGPHRRFCPGKAAS